MGDNVEEGREAVNPENVANLSRGYCFRTGYKRNLVHLMIDD